MLRGLDVQFDASGGDDEGAPSLVVRTPGDMPCDGVSNPAGPDAGYNAHRGSGYMAQIVETYAEDDGPDAEAGCRSPDLITHGAGVKRSIEDRS